MHLQAMGKRWLLVWVKKGAAFIARRDDKGVETRMGKTDEGLTEAPTLANKRMFIRYGLRGRRKLETAIHEFTHASDWWKDEEWVERFGHDLACFLHSLGYRCTEEPPAEPVETPEELEG
jgi:hypothetical protein